ncbi:CusA/CzcA family heavy metal efflux RND transporter [Hymenobacter sp. H14-R3]|uniref:CusA/CzcA family heavy metal efflux RND transporter n=1 Tax=Hymenobacter sp. H14-R3 TaxID=3046308 RepID=UPI0024BB67A1|nr:CusA/CzcA family heavy metal efflux RND transporter [Hymenobacter sp. H14-R3]MDJ0366691.1 CusA/CzcA family heavy metal efflux RND transporter [Hymenobacter sp. H14-R3]
MLEKIIAASVRNKLMVALLLLALIAWGGYSAANIPLDAIPDVTNNQVQVITQSDALAAQEVEQLITIPLELQLRTVPGVTEIRSISRFGLSVITVVFPDEMTTYQTRQLVAEKLKTAEADLAAGAGVPTMAPITTGLGEIYQYSIRVLPGYEKQFSLAKLRDVQDWIVKRRLAGVAGVVDVSSFGGYLRQYEVSVDPARLASNGVTMSELYAALQDNNANTGGAYIERGPNAYFIRGEGRANSLDDLGATVIKQAAAGAPLLVRDVATLRMGHAVRYGAMTRNGEGETVGAVVLMLKGASSEQTIKNVKARVAEIQKTMPKGLVITPFLDRTKLIDKAIATVEHNLIEGGVIVLAVLLLLLGNWRAAVVVALMIPLCMLFALGMMSVFGVSANLMSLGALDFGLIVDGAVIIVEAVIFHIVHQRDKAAHETMDDMTESAATRLMSSALFGQLIILIVYLPILSLTGIEGKMFRPMALTVSFAIIGAMLMCLTFVPAATAWALKKDIKEEGTIAYRIMKFLHRGYDPIIRAALNARVIVVGAAVALLVLAGFIFSKMGGEFIPQLDEGDIALNVTLAPGSSLSQTVATNLRIQQILKAKFPEIEQIVGKSGTSEIPTDPMSLEDSDEMVILKDHSEWTSADTREELANKMQDALAGIPGVSMEFQQPIQMRFNELISGVKSDVSIKIYGDDLAVLYEKANDAAALIRPLAGVGDLKVEQIAALPQMRVTYNRQKLAQYGLKVSDLNMILRTSFAGNVAGQVYEGERRYDLVMRLDSVHRAGLTNLQNLYVDTPSGQKIPLDEVATVAYKNAPIQISRDDARRRINIGINVRGRDVQSLVQEIQGKLAKGLKLPPGYTIVYGGQFENLNHAIERLKVAVPVSLLLIFLLLYLSFRSVKQALLIFTGVPLATIGGIMALWLRGMPFSISAGVGFIALFGVAVLNGIVLLASLNELAAEGVKSVRDRVLRATEERFRPVILTASVASLGFLPMALSTSAGAEVQKPLATVVIGGLISATLLTLVVLPVLYMLFTKDGEPNPKEAAQAADDAKHAAEKGEAPGQNPPAEPTVGAGQPSQTPAKLPTAVATAVLLLILLGGIARPALAQNTLGSTAGAPVNLGQALQTAGTQNQSLRNAGLQTQQQQALIRTGVELPRTVVDFQLGQISSNLNDRTFNIIQQAALPGVYSAQRKLLQGQGATAERQAAVSRRSLVQAIRSNYYGLLVSYRRVALLRRQDSLYRRAAHAALIRYKVGETNRLEQVAAQARLLEVQNRLLTTLSDLEVQREQLGQLLGSPGLAAIDTTGALVAPLTAADTAALSPESNPTLGLLRQQIAVSQLQTRVEQLRRLPDVRAGYFQQTLRPEYRALRVGQLGLAIPLLGGAGRARVAAARLGEQAAAGQLAYATSQLSTQLSTLRRQLRRAQASLDYYQRTALPQARLILDTAEKSFRAGDIDYVTYVVNTDPAWQIQSNYLDQAQRYNDLVVSLQALTGTDIPQGTAK